MLFSPKSPNFITLGQGVHENMKSYTGQIKKQNFRGNPPEYDMNRGFPPEYDMNRGFPRSDMICFHLIFVVSPDGLNSNLKNFF